MDRDTLVTELRTLRGEIARLNGDPWSPAVERSLGVAEMYLHLALWQLGEVEGLAPHHELHVTRERIGDALTVKVEALPGYPKAQYVELKRKAEQLLHERILVRIAVEIQPSGTLPRYELKAKRFFDHRER